MGTISTVARGDAAGQAGAHRTVGDAVFIGLPGNPVSSSVTFELFARPVIRKMQGARQLHRRRMQVRLGEDMTKPEALETYARAVLHETPGELPSATSSGDQGSSMLHSLTRADCLVVLAGGSRSLPGGHRRRGDPPAMTAVSVPSSVAIGPDLLGRALRDLRISVTDKCNFRCPYCMPKSRFGPGHRFLPRGEALDAQEIVRLATVFQSARSHQDSLDRWRAAAAHRPGRHRRGNRSDRHAGHRADHQRRAVATLGRAPARRRFAPCHRRASNSLDPAVFAAMSELAYRGRRSARWHRGSARGRPCADQAELRCATWSE